MKSNIRTVKLRKIDLSKADGCKHPDIQRTKKYLVNYDGAEIIGDFDKQWYGWNFNWFGSCYAGLQLDALNEVWEIC
jgi:hypothetical protein